MSRDFPPSRIPLGHSTGVGNVGLLRDLSAAGQPSSNFNTLIPPFLPKPLVDMAEEPDEIIDPQASHGDGSAFPPRSCYDCHRRKVKCSKVCPCDNCVRLGVECTFPPPGRKARKISKKPKKADLFSRLSFLEQQVQKLSASNVVFVPSKSALEGLVDQQSPDRDYNFESSAAEPHPSDPERRHAQTAQTAQTQNETHNEEPGATSSPSATNTLTRQFGQLFMDRNSGQSQYVSSDVLTDLGSQVCRSNLSLFSLCE